MKKYIFLTNIFLLLFFFNNNTFEYREKETIKSNKLTEKQTKKFKKYIN